MKPTEETLERLRKHQETGDDETYHATFDDILEERLRELDPEWMEAMEKIYETSEMSRWCA